MSTRIFHVSLKVYTESAYRQEGLPTEGRVMLTTNNNKHPNFNNQPKPKASQTTTK